jgi:DNA polymerase I-like protein with 3'-5' exonuclease and polymerase domains
MQTLTVDFETYYDRTYSLSKMTTEEYIRHEFFETIGVGVKVNDGKTQWFSGTVKKTSEFLDQFDWENSIAVAHNAMFDMAILNWHFDIRPKMIADTLSILRAIDGPDAGNSLAKAAERYGLGVKGDEVVNALGKRRLDFTPEELARYGGYCRNDVDLTYALFQRIAPLTPKLEAKLIDLTIRMFTEPVLGLDKSALEAHLTEVREKKDKLLSQALVDKKDLMSNPKLAELLRKCGVEPPMKVSPTTGKLTYAFSKTDEEFKALLEHENYFVQNFVAARLGVKSTLEETRTERFIGIAERGTLPVPLRYYAAHCLTGDAEVLTPTGWQTLAEWRGGDIAQWTPEGALRFASATANCFEVDEELVVSNARYHKAIYTKGHTIPGFSGRGVFKTLKAGDLLTKRLAIPLGGSLDGDNGLTELDARLAAMVQADGSIRDSDKDRSVRFGFKKPRKIARCKALLEQAGVAYTSSVEASGATRIRIAQAHWGPLVKLLSGRTKSFSPELLMAPLTTKIAFMEEIAFWDGDVEPHGKGYTYTTTNEHNARFVQTMAHVTGVSAFISEREREGWSKAYRVYVRRDDETRSEPKHYTTRRHMGAVYCPTTETGYFLVRQNGCITVTGNTGRWGGDDKVNLQNLPRKSPLKKAIKAPEGYVFIDCDSSQIEARTLAWLAGQDDLVEAFDKGEDVYKIMASAIYGIPVEEVTDSQRFVGKTTILGAGYGMGGIKFRAQLKTFGVYLSEDESKYIISVYRQTYPKIVALWKQAGRALEALMSQRTAPLGREGVLMVDLLGIRLPNGMYIRYPNLRKQGDKTTGYEELVYDTKKGRAMIPTRIYGGKVVENVCQALARIVIGEQMLMVARRLRVVMTVHDAVGAIAPVEEADDARAFVEQCMRMRPKWAAGLPLNCESKMGASYGG